MLRRDYLGSILVCSILFSLVGLGVYKASHVDLGLFSKSFSDYCSNCIIYWIYN